MSYQHSEFHLPEKGSLPEFVGQSSWKFPQEELSLAGALHSLTCFMLACALSP